MTQPFVSNRVLGMFKSVSPLLKILNDPVWNKHMEDPEASNFLLGNPQEMPLQGFVDTVQRWLQPQNKDWFAYKMSTPAAQAAVAAILRERRGIAFEPDDIAITNGAFTAIAALVAALTNPGDEIIFNSPPWFFYETLIQAFNAVPVSVKVRPDTFDLDLDAIAAAITPRTRAILVNSPNNPTGKIYPPETLEQLAAILEEASARIGHTIYLLSDEAYHRIVFDGGTFYSPAAYYPNTFVIYTYGKTLLTPGQRVGYIAMPPTLPGREALRSSLLAGQVMTGFGFANAILQYSIPELENLSIDIPHLQRKRDRMVSELSRMGYELHSPEGTFYLLVHSPLANDMEFANKLLNHKVVVLPGEIFECPGYFRISLTASDDMIERSLPGFEKALAEVNS
jgi:aspartate aminotransferase